MWAQLILYVRLRHSSVVPDRFLGDDVAYVLDPSMAKVAYLRPFKSTKLAKTGDSEKTMMNVEYTLVVNNELAHARLIIYLT